MRWREPTYEIQQKKEQYTEIGNRKDREEELSLLSHSKRQQMEEEGKKRKEGRVGRREGGKLRERQKDNTEQVDREREGMEETERARQRAG